MVIHQQIQKISSTFSVTLNSKLFLTLFDLGGADLPPARANVYTRKKSMGGNSDNLCIFYGQKTIPLVGGSPRSKTPYFHILIYTNGAKVKSEPRNVRKGLGQICILIFAVFWYTLFAKRRNCLKTGKNPHQSASLTVVAKSRMFRWYFRMHDILPSGQSWET